MLALIKVLLDIHLHIVVAYQLVGNLELLSTHVVLLLLTLACVLAGSVLAAVAESNLAGVGLLVRAQLVDVGRLVS